VAPSKEEFDAWLKVDIWWKFVIASLFAVAAILEVVTQVVGTVVGSVPVGRVVQYAVGFCVVMTVVSLWYVRRLGNSEE